MQGVFLSEECVICTIAPPIYILEPCNHACVCQTCALRVKRNNLTCPLCRAQVKTITGAVDGRMLSDDKSGGRDGGLCQSAQESAASIMCSFKIPVHDYPHIKAVIVEALLFEVPTPALNVSIENVVDGYKITFEGYDRNLDVNKWHENFMGKHRRNELKVVASLYVKFVSRMSVCIITINTSNLEG